MDDRGYKVVSYNRSTNVVCEIMYAPRTRLPANLLQAQRDYFAAHIYEHTDKPRGEFFHTNWTETGRDTASAICDV